MPHLRIPTPPFFPIVGLPPLPIAIFTPSPPTLEPPHAWPDYPLGAARDPPALGIAIDPANLLIRSTVPEGSGLSSSAALEVSAALAFLRGRSIDPLDLAKLCQRAERNY